MSTIAPSAFRVMHQPELPIELIEEFPGNPRRTWGNLTELADSIRVHGILEPLVVRPLGAATHTAEHTTAERYQLIAGARRLRAAKLAGLPVVPVVVRAANDQEALELAILENLQRKDVHPMDEALAYQRLQATDARYTPEQIAAKVARSVSYIYRRLRLCALVERARESFEADRILPAHAELLARLTPDQQEAALPSCFHRSILDGPEAEAEPAPVSILADWIEKHTRVEPKGEDVPHYFPELAEQLEVVDAAAGALLQLSESHMPNKDLGGKQKALLGRARWHAIAGPRDTCDYVREGVVVHGGPLRVLRVCVDKACSKHRPAPVTRALAPPASGAPVQDAAVIARAQQVDAARRRLEQHENQVRHAIDERAVTLAAGKVTKLTGEVAAELLRVVAEDYDFNAGAFEAAFGVDPSLVRPEQLAGTKALKALAWAGLALAVGRLRLDETPVILKRHGVTAAALRDIERAVRADLDSTLVGTCRFCACTEETPCMNTGHGGPCGWTDATRTVCTAKDCLKARDAALRADEKAAKAKSTTKAKAKPVGKKKARR